MSRKEEYINNFKTIVAEITFISTIRLRNMMCLDD